MKEDLANAGSHYARSLIEASLDPLVALSDEGKITDVNHSTVEVTGLAREKLIGMDFSDCFTEPSKAREAYRLALSDGVVSDHPLTIRHTDGHLTDVCYNANVYKDPEGRVLGLFAAARDLTELKKAGEDRSRLAAIVGTTMEAIIGKSIGGIVTSWNKGAERIFGYTAAEIIGQHVSVLIPESLKESEQAILDKLAGGGGAISYETQRVRKNGEIFDVSLTTSPVQDEDGVIIGV